MTRWRPGQPVRKWLGWAAVLYGLVVRLRQWCYHRGWLTSSQLPCRVLSVGNMTVGGTGKTPLVILLTEWLQENGQRVAVLSRGYKRTGTASHLLVSNGMRLMAGPSEAGDEPFLIARRCPQAIVAVGSDRAALGRWVLEQHPVDIMILDDGFQHRALHRDIDLVLLDATDATGLEAIFPAGRLREPLSGLKRATAVVITRADCKEDVEAVRSRLRTIGASFEKAIEVVFKPESLVSVSAEEISPLDVCRGKKTWLVSGIGNGDAFRRTAVSLGVVVLGETSFGDHHSYCARDVRRIQAAAQGADAEIILTTEKDAGKLGPFLTSGDAWWALRLRVEIMRGEDRLRRLICTPSHAPCPEAHA